MRIDIKLPHWISRPKVRRAEMVKRGKGYRSFESTGTWGTIHVLGPFWVIWIKEIVIENAVVERYKKIRKIRLDKS